MLRLNGLNKYKLKSEAQKAQIRQGAANYVRQSVRTVLRELVLNTPQWSGNTAASWRIDLNSLPADEGYSRLWRDDWMEVLDEGGPAFIGNKLAWKVALEDNATAFKAIRYNSNIRIVNVAPFADELATGDVKDLKLRKGNYIPGDVMAVKLVAQKHGVFSNEVGLRLKRDMSYD
jgi:hypothetical protein